MLRERTVAAISSRAVYIVLPAFNEQHGLARLLPRICEVMTPLGCDYRILVVDDASTDATAEVASELSSEMPLEVLRHRHNQGLSGAIETGLTAAMHRAAEGDVIVSMDADDTHTPAHMRRMLQMIDEGYDVVVASRYQSGSRVVGVSALRRLLPFLARYLFKITLPIPGIRDYTCGYRAYRCSSLSRAYDHYGDQFFTESGFPCMADILLKMRGFNFVMGEVPLLLRYDRKHGPSKMRVAATAVQSLLLIMRRRFGK